MPAWLSWPILIGSLIAVPFLVYVALVEPLAVLAGLVPLLIVLPPLAWLDRVEPEPRPARLHAVLWGALVAGTVSALVNSLVFVFTNETVAAVISAPLVEEATKGLGIYWALRRHEVDGVVDGIVYAGWVALGFAVVEDIVYFFEAAADGILVPVFVVRALLTPFAHPLFTAWIGLAIGLAVARRTSVAANALWGYLLAVVSHAAWNGSLAYADQSGNEAALGLAALCFVALFVAAAVTAVVVRGGQRRQFESAVPLLAARYGIPDQEARVFSHWRTMLAARRNLPRRQRRDFDAVHASLARLAMLHGRAGPVDPADERRLADQLQQARLRR